MLQATVLPALIKCAGSLLTNHGQIDVNTLARFCFFPLRKRHNSLCMKMQHRPMIIYSGPIVFN